MNQPELYRKASAVADCQRGQHAAVSSVPYALAENYLRPNISRT
jgi:hypothetical protein